VRRILAVALLTLFSFSLVEPAVFASDAESRLPACCRRLGNHHCAIVMEEAESSPGASIQPSLCRYFPDSAVKSLPIAGLLKTVRVASLSMLSFQAYRRSSDTPYRVSFRSTCQKRGPPRLFLS
jgi:hypothetical protein